MVVNILLLKKISTNSLKFMAHAHSTYAVMGNLEEVEKMAYSIVLPYS